MGGENAVAGRARYQQVGLVAGPLVAVALILAGAPPTLSDAGKCIIMLLMFLGRLGPISVFVAVSLGEGKRDLEFASEEPLLG